MTREGLQQIESALAIRLPEEYRRVMTADDLSGAGEFWHGGLFNRPEAVIERTRKWRDDMSFAGRFWSPAWVAVSEETNGDVVLLDAADPAAPLWLWDHVWYRAEQFPTSVTGMAAGVHPGEYDAAERRTPDDFILHFDCETEFLHIVVATVMATRSRDGVRVDLDAETSGGAITVVNPGDMGHPRARVSIIVESLDAGRLVGRQFAAPLGGLDYYEDREDLRDNVIEFVEQADDWFRVRWTATTRDFMCQEGGEVRLEIDGWFRFEDWRRWSARVGGNHDLGSA